MYTVNWYFLFLFNRETAIKGVYYIVRLTLKEDRTNFNPFCIVIKIRDGINE